MLSQAHVAAITGNAARWYVPLRAAADRWSIDTPLRLAHWLAQCGHESAGFTRLVESMHYSAARLFQIFPRRFTPQECTDFAFDDIRIAERVYGGRYGNRPEGSGDGWKYRARGLIGITFADNYLACGPAIGADLIVSPQLLEADVYAADSAGWYWATHGCQEAADRDDLADVTRAVNGGDNGIDDRAAWLVKTKGAIR